MKTLSKLVSAAGLLMVLGLTALPAEVVSAKEQRPPPETRKVEAMRKYAFERLSKAQEAMGAEKPDEAIQILNDMDPNKLNKFESASRDQAYGFAYANKEDFKRAIQYFDKAIESGALAFNTEQAMLFNTAQLYIATENVKKGITMLEEWLRLAEEPTGTQFMTIANAYVQDERYDDALPLAEKAIATTTDPAENWINLLASLYLEKKSYAKARPHLETLATRYPKKEYWTRLAAVYGELGQDKKSLVALELSYGQGLMTEDRDLVRLATLYLFNEIPYKAALLLDEEMKKGRVEKSEKNLELLGSAWLQARELEKSVGPLSQAAGKAKDGKLWVRVAQVQIELEDWKGANQALAAALDKGDVEDVGNIHLLRGIALYNSGDPSAARQSFNRAMKFKDYTKAARQWIRVMESKSSAE